MSKKKRTVLNSFVEFFRTGNVLNVFEWLLAYLAFMLVLLKYSLTLITASNYRLDDCLSRFFSQELLSGENSYQCDKCKQFTDCVKQLKIQSLPDILTIHLNRYQNNSGHIHKLTSSIEFPITGLDTSRFLSEDCSSAESTLYDLVAVIAHSGAYMNSGHYVCYALNESDQEWYLYDDNRVMRISTNSLIDEISSVAYILFYRKSIFLSEPEDTVSTIEATRNVCFDLEDIHLSLNENDFKNHEFIRNCFPFNPQRYLHGNFYNSPVYINRDAVYLPRYWMNLFINTENPGLFNNYETFCPHGFVRQTEWLFFNRLVTPTVKSVGTFLFSIYGDIFASSVLPQSNYVPCQACFRLLYNIELVCEQTGTLLRELESTKELMQRAAFFNGTIEVLFDFSPKTGVLIDYEDKPNGDMAGDLVEFCDHTNGDDEDTNINEKLYFIPFEWFISLRHFASFENLGKEHWSTDYRQMLLRFEEAFSSQSPTKLERIIPYPLKPGQDMLKLPFLPFYNLYKIGERSLRNLNGFSQDRSRNRLAVKTIFMKFMNQIDYNIHCITPPKIIDNWTLFGIKDRIFEFLEKHQKDLPRDNSEDSLRQLSKLIRSALADDVFGYHFDGQSTLKEPFDNELKYYVEAVSENVWKTLSKMFDSTLEISTSYDNVKTHSFTMNLDDKAVKHFYEIHYRSWLKQHKS